MEGCTSNAVRCICGRLHGREGLRGETGATHSKTRERHQPSPGAQICTTTGAAAEARGWAEASRGSNVRGRPRWSSLRHRSMLQLPRTSPPRNTNGRTMTLVAKTVTMRLSTASSLLAEYVMFHGPDRRLKYSS